MTRLRRAHKDLNVWKEAVELAAYIYKLTAARSSSKEFPHFLSIVSGSLSELDTQCETAFKLNYLDQQEKNKMDGMTDLPAVKLSGLMKNVKGKAG